MITAEKDVVKLNIPVNVNFTSAFLTGIVTGIGFHPIDRILYLRMIEPVHARPHWFHPKYLSFDVFFTGLRVSIYQRVLSHGIYFALQGEFRSQLLPVLTQQYQLGEKTSKFMVGALAGTITGIVANASYAVKFYTLTKNGGGPLENAIEMWKKGGLKPFFKGINAGASRDLVFGSCYEGINAILDENVLPLVTDDNIAKPVVYGFSRFFSAILATSASSPLNYVRNLQFSSPPHQRQPRGKDLLSNIWSESLKIKSEQKGAYLPMVHHIQKTLMIGPGTIRAGAGIATGQMLFDAIKAHLLSKDESRCAPKL